MERQPAPRRHHQPARALHVEPQPGRRAHQPQHDAVAPRAAEDGTHRAAVDPRRADLACRPAARAGEARHRHVERKQLAQQPGGGIAVECGNVSRLHAHASTSLAASALLQRALRAAASICAARLSSMPSRPASAARNSCSSSRVDVNREARRGVDFRCLLGRRAGLGQLVDGCRLCELAGKELACVGVEVVLAEAAQDLLLLGRVDAAIRGRCGDHGAQQQRCLIVGGGVGLEARAAGRGEQGLRRSGLGTRQRRLSLLVVLVRLVGKAADQRQAAELDGAASQRAAGAGAEDQRAEPAERCAGAQLVVGDQLLDLRHQLLRRAAGHLARGLAHAIGRAGGLVDAAGAFAHAGFRLPEHLAEDVDDAALAAARLLLKLGEDVARARRRPAAAAGSADHRAGCRCRMARLLPAADWPIAEMRRGAERPHRAGSCAAARRGRHPRRRRGFAGHCRAPAHRECSWDRTWGRSLDLSPLPFPM